MTNVLLKNHELPPFRQITPDQVQPAIARIIAENRQQINELLSARDTPSWDGLVTPLDELNDRLNQAWSPVQHMNSVLNSDALRDAYNACLPLLSEYSTELGQSPQLYQAFKALADSDEYTKLNQAQRKHIDNTLRDFHLAGVALPDAKKQRYAQIKKRLSELSSKFSENVLDATQAWTKHIEDAAQLEGVPESALAAMRQAAQAKGKAGYLITLEFPSYFPLVTYCENTALREEVYRAYVTRASDVGPNAGSWDNSALIDETLALRHELAELLGFDNYAAYSLATKMAESPQQVMDFLLDLAQRVTPLAKKEYAALQDFAQTEFGVEKLNPWDVAFYSEKLRQDRKSVV